MKKFCTFLVTFFVFSCSFNIVNAQIVNIPDANLAAEVRKQLNIPSGGPISRQAMQHLMLLYARNTEIKNLAGLEYATQLEVLDLRDNAVTDVSSLAKLKNLRRLKLSGNTIVDVSPLAGLENLRWLDLKNNAIIDISPLTTLKNTSLSLNDNPITVNFPLITNSIMVETGKFIVLSRNQNHSIQKGKVKIIYPDWQAFIEANPVVLKRSEFRGTIMLDCEHCLPVLTRRLIVLEVTGRVVLSNSLCTPGRKPSLEILSSVKLCGDVMKPLPIISG